MTQIVTGDDTDLVIQLQDENGANVNVSAATDIKVALANPLRTAAEAGPYTAAPDTAGANWGTGLVVVRVPSADSATIDSGTVNAEIQVILGGIRTTYLGTAKVVVVRGVIP